MNEYKEKISLIKYNSSEIKEGVYATRFEFLTSIFNCDRIKSRTFDSIKKVRKRNLEDVRKLQEENNHIMDLSIYQITKVSFKINGYTYLFNIGPGK